MKWQLAWIALVAAGVLVFGWFIYADFAGLVLARPTAEGLEIIAPSRNLIDVLWPLVVAGALGSAIPAWSFIVWMSLRLRDEEREDERRRLQTALETTQQQLASARAQAQAQAAAHDQSREWALRQREAAIAQAEHQLQQRQRETEQAQQEAAHQIEVAQARAEAAELRAQRATNAFRRVKRKSLLTGHPNAPTRT